MTDTKSPSTADRIAVVVEDITRLEVDIIVNAADKKLLGGGGVDQAIHDAAGNELLESCRALGGCEAGNAKVTRGFNLPASHVVHTVGPLWNGGGYDERALLESCYRKSLACGLALEAKTIAFPCISTGIYGYPKSDACRIAVNIVREHLAAHTSPSHVIFCCFTDADAELYRRALQAPDAN